MTGTTIKSVTGRRNRGFTLIEIMVAAAITIVMVGMVIQITSEVLKLWNRSMGKLSANAEARIAMELLTSDLEAAVLVNNGQQWLRVEAETDMGSPTVGQTVALKLFTTAMDRPDEPGNVCAVSYVLAEAAAYDGAKKDSFVLFRALEGPRATFDDLIDSTEDGPQQKLTDGFWSQTVTPNYYLAGNIVDFKVYVYGVVVPAGGDEEVEVILNAEGGDDGVEIEGDSKRYILVDDFDGSVDLNNYFYGGEDSSIVSPTSAEISLTIVSDEGLEILRLLADGIEGTGFENTQDGVDDVILQHGEVFKRRVHFQAKPF